MDLFRLERKLLPKHILVWLILEIILQILSPLPGTMLIMIISGLTLLVNTIFTFYFLGLYILPKYWKKYFRLAVGTLLGFSIYCLLYYLIGYHVLPAIGGGSNNAHESLSEFLNDIIFLYLIIVICASAFYLNRRSIYGLKRNGEKEKQLISKELNLIKGQFNNHLTFNFLNFCYSHIHKYSKTAAESIELFSDMLRNSLMVPIEEKIALQIEVDYINNYIQLQKIISTNMNINFNHKGELSERLIIPRLLVAFIDENLKHYELNNNGEPVNIVLKTNQEQLELKVSYLPNLYKINNNTNESTTQRVLDLFYKDKYRIEKKFLSAQLINKLVLNC